MLLIWAAIALPSLHRSIPARSVQHEALAPTVAGYYSAMPRKASGLVRASQADASKALVSTNYGPAPADAGQKIIRTSSLSMIVQHPDETTQKINVLIQGMGGYLVSSEDAGQNATSGALTVRVPTARFEEALAAIRKLGVRIESEKVDAQDVTQQYVDQDARIRNLKQEEAQYLTILKTAATVKDMLAVSENLSDVRGQIEQQQAEFNALSRQIETVAIAISLRTESEAQVAGLNWRPGYQLRLAMHDGLDSVADYATSMITVLFYLPAALLWAGTILFAALAAWKVVRWVGKRWVASKTTAVPAQG